MHAHGIDIFNKADGYHLIFRITHNLKFKLFPADNRFFYQYLSNKARGKTPTGDSAYLGNIIGHAASGSSHSIGRAYNNRPTKPVRNRHGIFNTMRNFALRHFNSQFQHCFLESQPVFPALDGIRLHTDYLDIEFFKYACTGKF